MAWTSHRDGILRAVAAGGGSAREAASRLGCTRSAVLGRAFRIGVSFAPQCQAIWTPEEVATLKDCAGILPAEQIARRLKSRSKGAVQAKAFVMGLSLAVNADAKPRRGAR